MLEAGDQFAVGGDQRLLGFDLGNDGLLGGEGWDGNLDGFQNLDVDIFLGSLWSNVVEVLFLGPHEHFQVAGVRSRFGNQANNAVGKAGREIEVGGVPDVRGNRDHNYWRLEELAR